MSYNTHYNKRDDNRITYRRAWLGAAVAACTAVALALPSPSPVSAADSVGTVTSFAPEAGAVLAGDITVWQNELLVNKTAPGYTAFNLTGAPGVSPIAAGIVKASIVFNGQLLWLDSTNTIKTANAGGVVTMLGTVPAGSDSMIAVGSQLWVSRAGAIDRYTPGATLGGATTLPATFGATSILRMVIGPDNNVWVIEKNPAVGGVDTITRWSPATATAVGSTFNLANSSADPIAVAAGSDNAVWIVEAGTNAIGRLDTNLAFAEFALPAGASAQSIVRGPDGAVWLTESALNNVARLTFSAGVFTRTPYPAPSSFGLKNLTVGPDGNIWAVGTIANRVARFGTLAPTTTTTTPTTLPATTLPATTVPPTTTAAPVTVPPTAAPTAPPLTAPPTRKCIKSSRRRTRVNGKLVTRTVCTKYR